MPKEGGPCQITFTALATEFTDAPPAGLGYTTIGSTITINREDQLEDATFTIDQSFLELVSQASSSPIDYVSTGKNCTFTISIAETTNLDFFALAFGATKVVDDTDATSSYVAIGDDAGLIAPKCKAVIKPYVGTGVSTNPQDWLTFPFATLRGADSVEIAFGLETQRGYAFDFYGLPLPTLTGPGADNTFAGKRVIRGDETATPA